MRATITVITIGAGLIVVFYSVWARLRLEWLFTSAVLGTSGAAAWPRDLPYPDTLLQSVMSWRVRTAGPSLDPAGLAHEMLWFTYAWIGLGALVLVAGLVLLLTPPASTREVSRSPGE